MYCTIHTAVRGSCPHTQSIQTLRPRPPHSLNTPNHSENHHCELPLLRPTLWFAMRPETGSSPFQIRSRKPSVAEQSAPSPDPRNAAPVSFFLRRGSNAENDGQTGPSNSQSTGPISQLSQLITDDAADTLASAPSRKEENTSAASRDRMSAIKSSERSSPRPRSRAGSATDSAQPMSTPLTPLLIPSGTASLPSSPLSLRKADEGSVTDEVQSQAIASSEEEEPDMSSALHDSSLQESAPQLIMPSIKMPSRRPFTARGKTTGRFKIMVTGSNGMCEILQYIRLVLNCIRLGQDVVDQVYRSTLSRRRPC
jgi:hypothetical protein